MCDLCFENQKKQRRHFLEGHNAPPDPLLYDKCVDDFDTKLVDQVESTDKKVVVDIDTDELCASQLVPSVQIHFLLLFHLLFTCCITLFF